LSGPPEFPLPGLQATPRIHPSAFIAPGAVVLGDVELGKDSSVWFSAVLRGDTNSIRVGDRTNIQDGVIVHCDSGMPAVIGDEVSVGHGAILHGCVVRSRVLVGIGARVLNLAEIGSESLVAAGALVPERMKVPPRSLVVGLPARVLPLPERFLEYIDDTWKHYVSYRGQYKARA
jgi:gamma-carbonic anhydrase